MEMMQNTNSVEQHVFYKGGEAPEKIQSFNKPTSAASVQVSSARRTIGS